MLRTEVRAESSEMGDSIPSFFFSFFLATGSWSSRSKGVRYVARLTREIGPSAEFDGGVVLDVERRVRPGPRPDMP